MLYSLLLSVLLVTFVIIVESYIKRVRRESIEADTEDLIDQYTSRVKKGMNKNEAISKLLENENIKKDYSKHELDFQIVTEIGDKKITELNDDFDWELPPSSKEADRLISECANKVKKGQDLHEAIDELYKHQEVQKYYDRMDLFYIVDELSGFVWKRR